MYRNWYYGLVAAVAMAGSVLTTGAMAQEKPADFPNRPINLVVMYPAGGGMDVTARTFAKVAEEQMGVSIRVENRVGGGGMVGHTSLAKETKPDGYTIGLLANPFLYTDILLRDAPFEIQEFEPFAQINFDPVVLAVNTKANPGADDYAAVMERAKTDKLNVGINPDSVFQFVMEFVQQANDVKFNFIPFDGGKQGVVALLAGDIDVTTGFYAEMSQYFESGDLKPIAISGDERHPLMPDVPTLAELGVPVKGQAWGVTRYVTVPPGTPEDRVAYLEAEFLKVLNSPEAAEAFKAAGLTIQAADAEKTKARYIDSFESLKAFLIESGRAKQ
jgi:tripartite-type tricarboxylate transporter receptor subunit TctC